MPRPRWRTASGSTLGISSRSVANVAGRGDHRQGAGQPRQGVPGEEDWWREDDVPPDGPRDRRMAPDDSRGNEPDERARGDRREEPPEGAPAADETRDRSGGCGTQAGVAGEPGDTTGGADPGFDRPMWGPRSEVLHVQGEHQGDDSG